mgnify:CR=1 FL=1
MAYAELNGIRLYYQAHGQGEALVLIPGIGADHTAWVPQVLAFRKRYRVVIFDPRGIGRTSRPGGPYPFRVLADDVAGLLDHLGIERANVLGQSLGGVVAQGVAIDYPGRVHRLVLVSTLALGDAEGFDPALAAILGAADGAASSDLSAVDTRKTMNALIALSFKRWPYRTAMQLLSRLFLRREMFDGLSDQAAASAGHTTIDRLHLIQAPTLVVTGTADRIIRPQASERLAAGIPGAKLVMVRDGSHAFNVEMASRFNREVLDFLQAGETGRSGR